MDDADLAAVSSYAWTAAGPSQVLLFIDEATTFSGDAGQGASNVGVKMYCLPPRPLSAILNQTGQPITLSDGTIVDVNQPVGNELWLLTMVDDRYFYPLFGNDILANDYGSTTVTWDDWYDSVRDALKLSGVSFMSDAVDAAYGTPSNRFTSRRQPLSMLLDAAAWQNGQRVCRHLTGVVDVQNFNSAFTQNAVDAAKLRNGQNASAIDGDFIPLAGGLFDDALVNKSVSVPEKVSVVFGYRQSGVYSDTPYVKEVALVDLDLNEFIDTVDGVDVPVTGVKDQVKVIVADLDAVFTNSSTPDNDAALTDYAERTAMDYYRWQLGNLDQVVTGIAAYDSNALIDSIKWTYNTSMCCTRIQRRRWNDRSLGMFRKSEAEGYLSAWPPDTTVNFVQVIFADTTSTSTPAASSPSTITVTGGAGIIWIWVGGMLHLDDEMGNTEDVTVLSVDIAGLSFTADVSVTFLAAVTITGIQNSGNKSPARVELFVGDSTTPDDAGYCWYKDANGNQPVDLSYHWCELLPTQVVGYPSTKIPLAVVAGKRTVAPASMAGIVPGSQLLIDTGGPQETVTVLSTTATDFTAVFTNAHGVDTPVVGYLPVYQDAIQSASTPDTSKHFVRVDLTTDTVSGAITGGTSVLLSGVSTTGLYVGSVLIVNQYATDQEMVTVSSLSGGVTVASISSHAAGATLTQTWDADGLVPAIEASFVGDSTTPALGADCWYSDTNQLLPIDGDYHLVFLTPNLVSGKKVYKDAIHPGNQGETFKSVDESSDPSPFSVGPTRSMTLKYADVTENTTDGGAVYTPRDTSATHHGVINIDTSGSVGSAFGGQQIGSGDKKQPANLNATASLGSGFDTINHTGITASVVKWKGVGSTSSTVSASASLVGGGSGFASLDFVSITTGGAANDYGYTSTLDGSISIQPTVPSVSFSGPAGVSGVSGAGTMSLTANKSAGPIIMSVDLADFMLLLGGTGVGTGPGAFGEPGSDRPCFAISSSSFPGTGSPTYGKYAYGVFPDDYTIGGIVCESNASRGFGDMYYGDGSLAIIKLPIPDIVSDPTLQYQCLIVGSDLITPANTAPQWATNGITLIGENVVTGLGAFDPVTMTQPYTTKGLSSQAGRITAFS